MEKKISRFRLTEEGAVHLAIILSDVLHKGIHVYSYYRLARSTCERNTEHGVPRFVVPRRDAWRGREQVIEIPEGMFERIYRESPED